MVSYSVLKFHLKIYATLNTLVKSFVQKNWTRQQIEIHYNLFDSVTSFVPQEEEKFISLLKENWPNVKIINSTSNE